MPDFMQITQVTPISSTNSLVAGEGMAVKIRNVTLIDINTALNIVNVAKDGKTFKKLHKSVDIIAKVTLAYAAGYDITFTTTLGAEQTPTFGSDSVISLHFLEGFIGNPNNIDLFHFDVHNPMMMIEPQQAIQVTAHTTAVMRFLEENNMVNMAYPPMAENETGYCGRMVLIDEEYVDWYLTELQSQLEGYPVDQCSPLTLPTDIIEELKEIMKKEAITTLSQETFCE